MRRIRWALTTLACILTSSGPAGAQPPPVGPPTVVQPTVVQPTVIGPIIGPVIPRPVIVRPPILVGEGRPAAWQAPPPAPPRLTDLPEPQAFVAPGLTGLYGALPRRPEIPGPRLGPYVPYTSPDTPADPAKFNIQQVVVKFAEGSALRLRGRGLAISPDAEAVETRDRLARAGVEPAMLRREVALFNRLVARHEGAVGRAAPQVAPELLASLRRVAERTSKTEMPDPNLFYFVHTQAARPEAAAEFLRELRNLRIVEAAYFQPIPFNAQDIPPTTTIDVTPQQGYFGPTPAGVDVAIARRFAGGRGEGVRIVDIEGGWQVEHEDLPPVSFGYGVNLAAFDGDHGTAVLGQIAAQENGFGANGIAPAAQIGWSSFTNLDPFVPWRTYFYSVGNALLSSGYFLRPGDIALIEQHFPNLAAGPCPNMCNCAQFGYVAVETIPYEHAAISLLTSAGVIVVEAAGNGQSPVTPASPRDSGAIVVGASNNDLTPACFTNFGPRVNVHAWGGGIGTLGYATMGVIRRDAAGNPVLDGAGNPIVDTVPDPSLRASGADSRQWYTRGFGGTSGASPIVVGSAALIQSTRAARGLDRLTPIQMRTLLVATGTPQAPGTLGTVIGPQPNLAAAIGSFIPDAAVFVRQTPAPTALAPGSSFTQTVTFQNSGGLPWTGYAMAIAQGDDGSFPWGTVSFTLGTPAAPVMPGDEVTGVFPLQAPAQPGSYALSYVLRSGSGANLAFSPRQVIAVASPNTTFDNATITIDVAPGSIRLGQPGLIIVTARNTGSTTWRTPGYSLRTTRTGRLQLPQASVAVRNTVGPGQAQTYSFVASCGSTGQGGFSVQMGGPAGAFGQSTGRTVVCQP